MDSTFVEGGSKLNKKQNETMNYPYLFDSETPNNMFEEDNF